MKDKLLSLLQQNARLTTEELAAMLDTTPQAVEQQMEDYEQAGIIRGYQAIIDEEKVDQDLVTAIIDLRVTPKKDMGFDAIAQIVADFDEVDSVLSPKPHFLLSRYKERGLFMNREEPDQRSEGF